MVRIVTDENFNGRIVRGLLRREPDVDLVRLQDIVTEGKIDSEVLAWAAAENRILVTHDLNSVPRFAYERVDAGQPMPGVFAVPSDAAIGEIVDDLILLALTSEEGEWEGRVLYLPLR